MDTAALVAVGAFFALLICLVFAERIPIIERNVLTWFSNATQRPRWFIFWVLVFLIWVPVRFILLKHTKWFGGDTDIVVMTFLWSVVPFMVENALKSSSALQMQMLVEMLELVKQSQTRSEEQEKLIIALTQKILNAMSEDDEAPQGGEV